MSREVPADAQTAALGRVLDLIPQFVQQWERDARALPWPEALSGGLVDARTLRQIARTPGLTAGELARDLGLAGSALTAVLNRLERAGLVVRERGSRDRRVVRVLATPAGHKAMGEAEALRMAHISRRFGALSAADLDQLAGILERMIRAREGPPRDPEEG